MIEMEHLRTYRLTLTVRGLLHIGNGQKLPKKEYLFDARTGTVSFLDEQSFFDLLIRFHLADEFERFCLSRQTDLYSFLLRDCRLTNEQLKTAIRYQIKAGDALDENHALRDISRFVRNGSGSAYVPGSSVKGAVRTALLFQKMMADGMQSGRTMQSFFEENYLHTLALTPNAKNAVNSLMRGIQISDSEPIADSRLTLASKTDGFVDGSTNRINLCRECVIPDTPIHFRMTLDRSVLQNAITRESVLKALDALEQYYQRNYQVHFDAPFNLAPAPSGHMMRLGGGAGFLTKSLAYPYLGKQKGLSYTSSQLARFFRAHHHENDPQLGISPRTMKYGAYRGKYYAFGLCEVSIQ